jgi:CSLREA domain-containing protein
MSGLRLRPLLLVALLGALLAGAAWSRPADAKLFVVNSTADAVDADLTDGVCLTAANTCTLRAAIQQANASAVADRINLPAGPTRSGPAAPARTRQ